MRRIWNEIRDHRLSAGLFVLYWLIVFGLDGFRWHKPEDRPEDMVRTVIYLHFLLPVIAAALVSSWRGCRPGRITSGMLAGAAVSVLDAAALLASDFIAFHLRVPAGGGWSGIFELVALLIGLGLIGSLLGLIGASGSAVLTLLLGRWQKPAAEPLGGAARIIPRRVLLVAGSLAVAAAVIVVLVVIPAVRADTFAGAAPERAATAFAVNAMLNMLIGIAVLAPIWRRSAGAGKVLVFMAGFVGFLLGAALLDAASALMAHGLRMRVAAVACLGCAVGDLGAGVLALVAVLRWQGKDGEVPSLVS